MSAVRIGPYSLSSQVILAPMAGVTDRPFRQLCRSMGAALAASEMLTSDTRLWTSRKSQLRLDHIGEPSPRVIQIAGSDPQQMARAARQNVTLGAQIIDINMGCPARKVCNKAAGSALMKDELLVAEILEQVIAAVDVPVTLKIRTGWDQAQRNAPNIARIAEQSGIAAVAIHGRTRADFYGGRAEYETIAQVRQQIKIPLFANGDIDSAVKAYEVLRLTGADAVLIGRAAQGNPWIFREVDQYLRTGQLCPAPDLDELEQVLTGHLQALYSFYGEALGVRIARKHLGWYLARLPDSQAFCAQFNRLGDSATQVQSIGRFFALYPEYPSPGTGIGEETALWQ
ncbi:tRNA-dihydrouridine synthase B [Azomonas agilis]|uniref:tRNA-dihydrouridine synthase B n=1 Tax=Azomonas agilis TaxID=116849 RepID=A0A562J2K2_9GAMM|nr:tRNA dihydrouridine synthase DusB [Azomonas agilis]TWH77511.1 tRNA-dihydrouridine synthase B [Azomonas agilis]